MIRVPVAKGWEAEIREPNRGEYPNNLGGAVEYTVSHWIYNVLDFAGGAIGVFLAGSLVKFLDAVEPHMVEYVAPLIDGMLGIPDMPPWFRDFLNKIRNPQNEVGAALLSSFSGSAVSAISGSLMGALFEPYTQQIRKWRRAALPDPMTVMGLYWRGVMSSGDAHEALARAGFTDPMISQLNEVMRPRMDVGTLAEGVRRKNISGMQMFTEMDHRGYTDWDINVAMGMVDRLLDMGGVLTSYHRKTFSRTEARNRIMRLGYTYPDANTILENAQVIPAVTDLVQMAVREAWRDDIASAWGYDEEFSSEFAWSSEPIALAN